MPLMPVLEWATDLAARSARFNASGEPMSGRFAPLRTATPMPERARSTRPPATTLPCLMRSSIASAVRMARSPPAPPSSSFSRPFVEPQVIEIFVPLVRSNAGTRSSMTDLTPLVQIIFIAAILSGFPNHSALTPGGRRCHFYGPSGRAKPRRPDGGVRQEDATMDSESARMVKRVAQQGWQRATFFTSIKFEGAPRGGESWSMQAWLSDLAGRTKALVEEVAAADLVVMVSSAGTSAQAAAVIGEACAVRKVMTMALIIGSEQRSNEELSKTLATLRPYASMLVIATGDEYIEEMLAALRA